MTFAAEPAEAAADHRVRRSPRSLRLNTLARRQYRADLHWLHRVAVLVDGARERARLDGRPAWRSDRADARPRLAQPDGARRSDWHDRLPAARDGQRHPADWLGEAGAGGRPPSASSAARLRARRGR